MRVSGDRAEAVVDAALVRGGRGEGMVARLPEAGDTWRIDAAGGYSPEMIFQPVASFFSRMRWMSVSRLGISWRGVVIRYLAS